MKKRLLLPWVSLSCLILAVIIIIPNGPVTRPQDVPPKIRLSLHHYFSGAIGGGFDQVLAQFNREQDRLLIAATPLDVEAYKNLLVTSFAGGNAPDLITNWAGERVRARVQAGLLEPIDELWDHVRLGNRFPEPLVEKACIYHGRKYFIPLTQHLIVFFYDRQFFAENSLVPPADWEQMLALARRIKELGRVPFALGNRERWPGQFWFDYLLLRTAGAEYREHLMQGKASYLDPEVEAVYNLWAAMIREGMFNADANQLDWNQAALQIRDGKAAMTLMGTWAIQCLEAPEVGWTGGKEYDFFAFPMMRSDIERVALGPVDGINLLAGSRHRDAALVALEHFTSRSAQEIMSHGSGALAPSQEVPASFYSPLQQRLRDEINRCSVWAFNLDLATPDKAAQAVLDSFPELLAHPDQVQEILRHVDLNLRNAFPESPNQ